MSMISVRFTPAMIAAVRHLARKDGITVSRWLRTLIERELLHPRPQPVDVSLYPQTETIASGADRCRFEWLNQPPQSVTS